MPFSFSSNCFFVVLAMLYVLLLFLQRDSASNKNKNLLLKFSLSWTDGPPQHLLCSNLDTALDLKKIRECKTTFLL